MSTSEKGFGAKLQKAQNLLNILSSFQNYTPPRPEESITSMQQLTAALEVLNTSEATQRENYRSAVDTRRKAFTGSPGSIEKLLSPIYNAVTAQYGKQEKQAVLVAEIIRKFRGSKKANAPADPLSVKLKAPVSSSERSFGALTKHFGDLVSTLSQYGDYNPSNPQLSVAALQQKQQQLPQYSAAVVNSEQALRLTRIERTGQYEELSDRVQRIKQYVRAQYGLHSPEHTSVKSIKA